MPVEVTDAIMPGVVEHPPRLGPRRRRRRLAVAAAHAGVNCNVLADERFDPLSGNAVLNGIPVEVLSAESGADGGGAASRAGLSADVGAGVGAGVPARPTG